MKLTRSCQPTMTGHTHLHCHFSLLLNSPSDSLRTLQMATNNPLVPCKNFQPSNIVVAYPLDLAQPPDSFLTACVNSHLSKTTTVQSFDLRQPTDVLRMSIHHSCSTGTP